MQQLKPGDRVIYQSWDNMRNWNPGVDKHRKATVLKIGRHRVTIELEDGKKRYVEAGNLTLITKT